MPKFILIDPSIVTVGGHYYEYAARLLDEAGRCGFEPILVANRRAHLKSNSWRILPIYRYGFFEPGTPSALLWARRMIRPALPKTGPHATVRPARGVGAGGRGPIRFWRKRRAFRFDSAQLLRTISLHTGDLVLLPTVAEAEMLGLGDLCRTRRETTNVAWRLLFRRDVPSRSGQDRLRQHLHQFCSQLPDHDVEMYTDTESLTQQYNSLGATTFRTLPIPTCREGVQRPPCPEFGTPGRVRHVVYLGDARTEKGYHWLPRLVIEAKAAHLPVRFTFQSNFNVPGGEVAVTQARAQLASLPAHFGVTLLTEPLSSDAYFRLLLAADVVVFPYDATAYKARSSGVFAEAMAAGKPVIVPESTWMASELQRAGDRTGVVYADPRDLGRSLARIVQDYDSFWTAAREGALSWSDHHSARTLLRLIAPRPPISAPQTDLPHRRS